MRASLIALFAISLCSSAAFAAPAIPATPAAVLNPPAYVPHEMSVDSNLPGDTKLDTDAKTLQGVEGQLQADPTPPHVGTAKDHYIRLNNQLGADIRNHASKETIESDRVAIAAAKKQLDLDMKACEADAKAGGGSDATCK